MAKAEGCVGGCECVLWFERVEAYQEHFLATCASDTAETS
jgi:hypothetical protein